MNRKKKLDSYSYHEAVDRTYIVVSMIDSFLLEHPVIENDDTAKQLIEQAAGLLGQAYQHLGAKSSEQEIR